LKQDDFSSLPSNLPASLSFSLGSLFLAVTVRIKKEKKGTNVLSTHSQHIDRRSEGEEEGKFTLLFAPRAQADKEE